MMSSSASASVSRCWSAYSDEQTFYRSPQELRRIFERHGLRVSFVADRHPRLRRLPGIGRALEFPPLRALTSFVLTNFVAVHLELEQTPRPGSSC